MEEEKRKEKKRNKKRSLYIFVFLLDMWAAALVLAAAGPEMPVLLLLLARGITGSARGLQLKGRRRFTLSTRFHLCYRKRRNEGVVAGSGTSSGCRVALSQHHHHGFIGENVSKRENRRRSFGGLYPHTHTHPWMEWGKNK